MKLSLSIESEDPPAAANPRWRPSANFVTQIAASLLRFAQMRTRRQREPEDANKTYGLKIRIASEQRGNFISRRV